eukprot:Rmarinus@m.19146
MATDVLSGFYECSECRKIRSCYWFSKSQFQLPSGGRCKKCIEEQVEKEKASGQQKRAKIAATRLRRDMKKKIEETFRCKRSCCCEHDPTTRCECNTADGR